jgi:hypothetical protein
MLPLWFELLNHLHKIAVQLGKGKKLSTVWPTRTTAKVSKKVSFTYKHGLMLFDKKNPKKPPGTSIKMSEKLPK